MITLSFWTVLAGAGVLILVGWLAGYNSWRWWRQPQDDQPAPIDGMQEALEHLNEAAYTLSLYTWNPSQAEGGVRHAQRQLKSAEAALNKIKFKGKP